LALREVVPLAFCAGPVTGLELEWRLDGATIAIVVAVAPAVVVSVAATTIPHVDEAARRTTGTHPACEIAANLPATAPAATTVATTATVIATTAIVVSILTTAVVPVRAAIVVTVAVRAAIVAAARARAGPGVPH
jgi:hypothetical protein